MDIPSDFIKLLECLNAHEVEYVIVGAYALAFYGHPRLTGDMDICVLPEAVNADKVITALKDFGFGSFELSADDFITPDIVIQLGRPPVRIDIMNSLTGISIEEIFSNRVEGILGNIQVHFIGRREFIKNKLALGRKKDLADIEAIGKKYD